MTSLLAAVLAAALAILQASPAPSKPDFSGRWTLEGAVSDAAKPDEPTAPVTLNITQSPEEIVVETIRNGKTSSRTFPIDLSARPEANASPSVSPRAYWNNARLVTEGAINIQGQTVSTRESLSLNPARTELTVERLVVVQHGYSFRGAQNYGTAKDVYTRAPQ
jgi:hypothetical protein